MGATTDTGFQIQHYEKKVGRYQWHCDLAGLNRSYRQLACILYLNSVEEGGETEFKHPKYLVKPEQGKVILFPPFWTHTHRGRMPISGDKTIITTFIGFKSLGIE